MSTPFRPDLDAYFARIGYTGPRTPTLETLRALHRAHLSAIPFENLDVLLGRPINIEPAVVERKLVHDRRGGYCFENNTLFRGVLEALGFTVTPFLARVRWQVPPEVPTALTHMVLRVELDGRPWLADVGFGSVGSPVPLALDTTGEQATTHGPRRLVPRDGYILHQLRVNDTWSDVYHMHTAAPTPADFELGNWYSCTHPRAHFRNNLIVSRVRADERMVIFNREFTVRRGGEILAQRELGSPEELLAVLAEHFGLHFPAGTRFGGPGAAWPN